MRKLLVLVALLAMLAATGLPLAQTATAEGYYLPFKWKQRGHG